MVILCYNAHEQWSSDTLISVSYSKWTPCPKPGYY